MKAHSVLGPASGAAPARAPRPTILVIDDDRDILGVIRESLELEGYPVVSASNGRVGLRLVEREQPSLVLLDMHMPEGDGWEFAAAMRARGLRIPILVVTAAATPSRYAAEIEADAYLEKPFDIEDLVGSVRDLLERTTARRR